MPDQSGAAETYFVHDVQPVLKHSCADPDELIGLVSGALRDGEGELQALLDDIPLPIYLTDADGWVTFFNRACARFAGREPVPGQDRWCVTWRLYTEGGAFLPHEACPMALAVKERRRVRGVVAVAERPDGSRVMFAPHPTVVLDEDGEVIGAVNVLLDATDRRQADLLTAQAQRCRRLAQSVTDHRTIETLTLMASEYEERARSLGG